MLLAHGLELGHQALDSFILVIISADSAFLEVLIITNLEKGDSFSFLYDKDTILAENDCIDLSNCT